MSIETSATQQALSSETPPSPEFQKSLEAAFELAERRADYIGVWDTPTMKNFADAGVDFEQFVAKCEQMKAAGLEPQVILAMHLPLAPRHEGDKLNFRTMLANLTADKTIPNNPFERYDDDGNGEGPGLWVNSSIYDENGSSLFQQEINLIKQEAAKGNCHYVEKDGIIYTLGPIPGTDRPQDTSTNHTANQNDHSTISDLLTQNIDRIMQGQQPVDTDTYTWAYGTFSAASRAAGVIWLPDFGQLYVYGIVVSISNDSLGVRRRVWG